MPTTSALSISCQSANQRAGSQLSSNLSSCVSIFRHNRTLFFYIHEVVYRAKQSHWKSEPFLTLNTLQSHNKRQHRAANGRKAILGIVERERYAVGDWSGNGPLSRSHGQKAVLINQLRPMHIARDGYTNQLQPQPINQLRPIRVARNGDTDRNVPTTTRYINAGSSDSPSFAPSLSRFVLNF